MPPQGSPRPEPEARSALVVDADERRSIARPPRIPIPGRPLVHRLNRAEYANAIRDLLALDVDASSLLPPDDAAYGFDNIADVLGVSPVAAGAVPVGGRQDQRAGGRRPGDRRRQRDVPHPPGRRRRTRTSTGCRSARSAASLCADDVSARRRVRVSGQAVPHEPRHRARPRVRAPARGRDRRRARPPRDDRRRRGLRSAARRTRPTTGDAVDARLRVRVPLTAGPHDVTVAFLERTRRRRARCGCSRSSAARIDTLRHDRPPAHRHVHDHRAVQRRPGPATRRAAAGSSSCRPASAADGRRLRASGSSSTLARRAYRGPVEPLRHRSALMTFYREGRRRRHVRDRHPERRCSASWPARSSCSASNAIRPNVARRHAVPHQRPRARVAPVVLPLEQHPRRRAADAGRGRASCTGPAVLDAQVRRMLADPSAPTRSSTTSPASGCSCATCGTCSRTPTVFPDFDDNLRQAFQRETELFFESIVARGPQRRSTC